MSAPEKEKNKELDTQETNAKSEDLGLLEEDDEFEEFPAEDFRVGDDEEELNVWEDNWDDDNVEDDFSQQLKAHLESKKMET
ncbi:probable 26S proteasome complex subunit sem1 [Scaptodrosophila lebanonensis]|uniref:26S proteasome complex subunit SEM1 n=1 Tax=Drosophila lebanonensis TaxID=7225 RepID=A0A6J2UA93_DROLE|nr:probable 26S proteasome complex subunit sem1 [Scaptodrosophila lebanonensis]